jgi:hypothetical protein
MVSNTRYQTGGNILSRYSPKQRAIGGSITQVHHTNPPPQVNLPDSQTTTHEAPGLNVTQKTNTKRGIVADSTVHEEVTTIKHERVDQTNVHTSAQF